MISRRICIVIIVLGTLVWQATGAGAQCMTVHRNLTSTDLELFGKQPNNHSSWVGQRFSTDCDGQFLTARFLIHLDLFGYNGGTPLTGGDVVTCSILDDQLRLVASVDQVLTHSFNLAWVEFDFEPLKLGLAAGDLIAMVDTPLDAYGYVATDGNVAAGELIRSYDGMVVVRDTKDAAFEVRWDPYADIVAETQRSWGAVKLLYR